MESNIDQFRSDLKAVFSTVTEHVPHEDHLGLYGGVCSIDEPYREIAIDEAAIHRQANANNPLTIQDARREVESEARSPSQKTFQSFIGQVRKHKGQISREALQRFAEITSDYTPVNAPKPHISELVFIELEKVENTNDLECMSRIIHRCPESYTSESLRSELQQMLNECIFKETEKPILGRIKGPAMPRHSYIVKKGLNTALKALEASSSFVETNFIVEHNTNIIVPAITAQAYAGITSDAVLDRWWHIDNCATYQQIPPTHRPDQKKTYCTGTKTKGTFHPVGNVFDAPLVLALEGFATTMSAYECSGYPSISVGGCGNFLAAGASLLEADICSRILLIGDSGTEAKLKKATEALVAHHWSWRSRVAWTTVVGPDNYDLNDLMIDSGVEAVKDFIDDKVLRFHDLNAPDVTKAFIRSGRDILADTTVVNCLLEDIIPVGSFGVIVGETGAGKSFFALALALCLTSGMSFYGRSVQQGGSLYVAAEGNRGYRRRMKAWLVKNRFAEVPEGFFMTTGAVDLLDVEAMRETALFCKENDVTSVFFDTFHRCFSGEENSARDVGTALQNIGKYFSELGIAVILIHHSGLSTTSRGRGSSALKSGADFELIIEKCDGGLRLNPSKIKDGELFPAESFILVPQGTGLFDHKGEITSLVLEKGEARRTAQLSRKDSKLWSALQQLGESFTREEAEDCTFSMIDAKNKGQTLTRLLTRLETFEAINYSDDNYLILK